MPRLLCQALCLLGFGASVSLADPLYSGGATSTQRQDASAFSQPAANLSHLERLDFSVGNSFFRSPWVSAPASTTARDGLGPLFNTTACISCHVRDGRGQAHDSERRMGMLVRLSVPAANHPLLPTLGVVPEPTYGVQIQDMALPGIPAEAKVRVRYEEHSLHFADGFAVSLRAPTLVLSQLGYGPMASDTQFSVRIAPPMIGLGLLAAIAEEDILDGQTRVHPTGDPIQGQANWVWDSAQGKTVLGRFGWKAGQPNLAQQNAHALANDLGLTSALVSHDDCTEAQRACRAAPHGGEPEVSERIAQALVFYTQHLAVPMRRKLDDAKVIAGEQLFHQAGCAQCHTPRYVTSQEAPRALAGQTIYPYSDLLLHDMGEGLADGRAEFVANGRQWRTPPLWGLGLTQTVSGHSQLLHDGRARTVLEAILWHGGEAAAAKDRVLQFNANERDALLAFLDSL